MKTSGRWRVRLAAATAALLVFTVGWAATADADVVGNPITGVYNSSDPELIQCPTDDGTGTTLCLFTSQDMGWLGSPYVGGTGWSKNYYPMDATLEFKLRPGTNPAQPGNWTPKGAVVMENELNSVGVVPNSLHEWAPGVRYAWGYYWLYVPDVVDPTHESTSSRIFGFYSADGANWYYWGEVATPGAPNGGYASDPELFIDGGEVPYLVYADGDDSNCGGEAIGQLDYNTGMSFVDTVHEISISGWADNLGNCSSSVHRPYLEGGALYSWNQVGASATVPWNYLLLFAAKPNASTPPTGCGTSNEVIAYATSPWVEGPYTYGGIVMCGSSVEWTNQASIAQNPQNGNQFILAYHDGDGSSGHNRQTHLMCLKWTSTGSSAKIVQITRSQYEMSNC